MFVRLEYHDHRCSAEGQFTAILAAPMKKRGNNGFAGGILARIAKKIGATVRIEPVWGAVGQITFRSGRKRYFRDTSFDINTMGASAIATDKDYANFFMKSMGYPTIEGRTFFSDEWAKTIGSKRTITQAFRYAKSLQFPVIVKPNSGSRGVGVALVHTKEEFYRALKTIFHLDKIALIQTPVTGKDYRIVVLDNKAISAYERIPLNIIGDGKSTIKTLLRKKQRAFVDAERDTNINILDPRIRAKLQRNDQTLDSIPARGIQVFLLDNANLSSGGDSVDVTNSMHPDFKDISVKLTSDMGLRLCGVDLMIESGIEKKPKHWWILEINSAPGLDHYARGGKAQQKIVEDLYLEVLKGMDN